MDTQHCLQCELHKDRVDQDGCKYCYCFFNPDKGRWVAEIENCPKLVKHSGSSEIPKNLEEKAKEYCDNNDPTHQRCYDCMMEVFKAGAKGQKEHPEVDYNEFEKLFADFCERNKGHHITSHDACMWFWELGLNTRKV